MGISKEDQKNKYRLAGDVSFNPQPKLKTISPISVKAIKTPRKKKKVINTKVYKEELINCNNNKIKVIYKKEHIIIPQPTFIKRAVKLLEVDDKRISFYDTIRWGKYKGRTGRQVLKTNKKYLKRLQADQNIIFCPIMIARLKN